MSSLLSPPSIAVISQDFSYQQLVERLVTEGMPGHQLLFAEDVVGAMNLRDSLTGHTIFLVDSLLPNCHGVEIIKTLIATARVPIFCYCRVSNLLDPQNRGQIFDADALPLPNPPIQGVEEPEKTWQKRANEWLKEIQFASRLLSRSPYLDTLTGVYTREFAQHLFKLEYLRVCRSKRDRVLVKIFIDIDDFKGINTVYGYAGGDNVLRKTGQKLKEMLRRSDIVSRASEKADEFEVDLVEKRDGTEKMREPSEVAARIQKAFECFMVILEDGREVGVSASVGCATLKTFLHDADIDRERMELRKIASEDMARRKQVKKRMSS